MIPNEKNNTKPLKIYSASAGSGKTYNLVLMYLRLILSENVDDNQFSKIIAMTFTNKAAIEMKVRIMNALNILGNFDDTNKNSIDFLNNIQKEIGIKKEVIITKSKKALKQILHQYEQFNVLTIDKFNLRLIRSFSRDLNLNSEFQTTTNEKDIINEIVDLILSEINQPTYQELTDISIRYASENLENESKWDFKDNVKDLAENLIKENYYDVLSKLLEMDFSLSKYNELKKELNSLKKELETKAKEFHTLFFSFDTENVPNGKTTVKAFENLLSDKIFKIDVKTGYFFSDTIIKAFENDKGSKSFHPEIKSKGLIFIQEHVNLLQIIDRKKEFSKNYFNLAILKFIAVELDKLKKTDNIILISEFNKLISDLLKNEEAPYIYERIGNRYQHFLLDEFQDTSRLQWNNLVPLVHDSLSNNNLNLIVGDPKQSIYRFKNGLAEQFIALPEIYNPEKDPELALKSDYFLKMGETINLGKNWRSKREIIEFNNLFFKTLISEKEALLESFYNDVSQEFNENNNGGYIYFESYVKDSKSSKLEEIDENEEQIEEDFDFLIKWITDCLSSGYDYGDICILGYRAKDCNKWASFLSKKGLKVVSADSLLLGSNHLVQGIISYFKWRINPNGELEAKRFAEFYFNYKGKNALLESIKYWKTKDNKSKSYRYFDSKLFLIDQFGSDENFFFHYENLYQLVQKFYQLLQLNELENPFVHQFSDYVFQFDQNKGPNLKLFVETFEKDAFKISVQIPENKDAIKILTAHKSKGLEFPIVFIPTLNWEILRNTSKYLIEDEDLIYYTNISKNSNIIKVREFYQQEFNKALIDKINLMYVAFTRPKNRLYIKNEITKTGDTNFNALVHKIFLALNTSHTDSSFLEFGSKTQKEISEFQELNVISPINLSENLWFPDISIQDNSLIENQNLSDERRFGNQLHELLSCLNHTSEIEIEVEKLINKGKIESNFKISLIDKAKEVLNDESYKNLISNYIDIFKEQNIISEKGEILRPDLIVLKKHETILLDYKTGSRKEAHVKQIQTYCSALSKMNLPPVKAFLFYTSEMQLEQIN